MLKIEQVSSCFDDGYLHLFVFPTEQCNFRCSYCYEDFEIGRMRPAVSDGVKALISQRCPELHTLQVSWFGGEPLLAKSIIEDISLHISQLALRHSVNYKANVTTNGYFLDIETASRLAALGVTSYQVSLDGPSEVHDRTRVRRDGSGSFSQIWANLLALRRSSLEFKIVLRVHFSPDTHESLEPLIRDINLEFQEDQRFGVFFKAVERLGGPNDSALRTFSRPEKENIRRRLISKLSRSSQEYEIAPCGETYICYAAKPNSLVIRANGDVAKCTVALYDERNRVGRLQQNGEIAIDQDKIRWWMRGFASLKDEELNCPNGSSRVQSAPLIGLTLK
jgi:uncharacterized protein